MQYTYALSQSAYLRALRLHLLLRLAADGPDLRRHRRCSVPSADPAASTRCITHTAGGALDFQDQINDQNLVTLDGNYTTAGVIRFNNYVGVLGCRGHRARRSATWPRAATASPATIRRTGKPQICLSSGYYNVAAGGKSSDAGSATRGRTAGWPDRLRVRRDRRRPRPARRGISLWSGNVTGSLNTVRPRFTNASLQDQWRPSDKFLINAAIRYDNFTYVLPDSATTATRSSPT